MLLFSRFIISTFVSLVLSFSFKQAWGGQGNSKTARRLAAWFAEHNINVAVAEDDEGIKVAREIKASIVNADTSIEENAVHWDTIPGTELGVFKLLRFETGNYKAKEALPICFKKLLWKNGINNQQSDDTFINELPGNFKGKNIQVIGVEYFWRYPASTHYSMVIVYKLDPTKKANQSTPKGTPEPKLNAVEITPVSNYEAEHRVEQPKKTPMTRQEFIKKIDELTKTAMKKGEQSYLVPSDLNTTDIVTDAKSYACRSASTFNINPRKKEGDKIRFSWASIFSDIQLENPQTTIEKFDKDLREQLNEISELYSLVYALSIAGNGVINDPVRFCIVVLQVPFVDVLSEDTLEPGFTEKLIQFTRLNQKNLLTEENFAKEAKHLVWKNEIAADAKHLVESKDENDTGKFICIKYDFKCQYLTSKQDIFESCIEKILEDSSSESKHMLLTDVEVDGFGAYVKITGHDSYHVMILYKKKVS